MTKFMTIVEDLEGDIPQISPQDKLLLMGSCFTENIGQRLQSLKFETCLNPYGILYNPASIAHGLKLFEEKDCFEKKDLFLHNHLWHSANHHGVFSNGNPDECIAQINENHVFASAFLNKADFLIITFGTAWVFEDTAGNIVANCHKLPASNFTHKLLSPDEIITTWAEIITLLLQKNPKLNILFTVSPVRHTKDGAVGNNHSKAILLVAVHELCKRFKCMYFPAYEIMMDELRDYRYYADDMLHPSNKAIEHIFERFGKTCFSPETAEYVMDMSKLHSDVHHRPLYPNSEEYKKFIQSRLEIIKDFKEKYPHKNFDQEVALFQNRLSNF